MLKDKNILLGITGSISAYKACDIVSRLVKLHANVNVIMTENATRFVQPITLETLSKHRVVVDTFDRSRPSEVEHIALAKSADIVLIAPATANIIGKIASGIADDMLTSTVIATLAPVVICPAMNTNMYSNAIVQSNIERLKTLGYTFVEPVSGVLACGDTGKGKLSQPEDIVDEVTDMLLREGDLEGKSVLITAGGTSERIDRVRCITNHSTGKMGIAIAREAERRGAHVTLIVGNITTPIPSTIIDVIHVESTDDMYHAVMAALPRADYIIKSAAPSDYRVKNYSDSKIKAEHLTLELEKNVDIAAEVGKVKGNKKLVVFSAETENLIDNAKAKLLKKNADLVVANDVTVSGAGFGVDTNVVSIIDRDMTVTNYPLMSKSEVAKVIIDKMIESK